MRLAAMFLQINLQPCFYKSICSHVFTDQSGAIFLQINLQPCFYIAICRHVFTRQYAAMFLQINLQPCFYISICIQWVMWSVLLQQPSPCQDLPAPILGWIDMEDGQLNLFSDFALVSNRTHILTGYIYLDSGQAC